MRELAPLTLESASRSCCLIVQGSCALGSLRMQPGSTNRIDAAGALIARMGDGLGSIASSCESYWERHCHLHEAVLGTNGVLVERTWALWR